MTTAPIAFRSDPGKYLFLGATQLVNAHAEKLGPDSKGALGVMPSDGLVQFSETGSGTPTRGMLFMEDLDKLYVVQSSSCYKITSNGTATRIGTVPGTDTVQMSRNQKTDPEVVIKTDAGVQVIASDALSYVTDTDLTSNGDVITADYASNFHLYGFENRVAFFTNANEAKIIDPLDFFTAEQRAGKLVRIIEDNGEAVFLCSSWTQFFRNVDDPDEPFHPIAFKGVGLKDVAADAVVKSDNTILFPTNLNTIVRVDNYNPIVVSSNEVSRLLEAETSDMLGFSYDRGGHAFSVFTGTGWTRSFDAATQVWHSRQSYGQTTWRAQHSVKAFGKTLVGDKLTGKIFYLDSETFTEDGDTLVWKVISPPLHVFPNGAVLDAVHFDVATGYGTLSGQGVDPKIMLRVSKDGGETFGQYRELSLGAAGDRVRVTARRLGEFGPKGIVFELSISDPVARSLVNCDVQLRPLKR